MDNFEIKSILDTFEVLVDTREQVTPRASERYKSFGVPFRKQTLNYGDYTYNIAINGNSLHPPDLRVNGWCVIERKQNLDELAMCLTRSRERFQREFERAADHNAKSYLLIENASWDMIYDGQYRSKFKPKSFIASLTAWQVRYDLTVVFCEARHSGKLIKEILYRDIKERLERGEFG
jgi:ERCC4-type nuclease